MTNFQNSYLVDDYSQCEGCNKTFHNDQIIPSIQEPYYVCKDCENDLIKEREEYNEKVN